MLFMVILTSVFSSEYLVNLLLSAHLALFLGPLGGKNASLTKNLTEDLNSSQELHINGTYFYEKSENFDEYLTELGVGYFLRQLASLAFPILTVSRSCTEEYRQGEEDSCQWSIKTDAGLRTHSISFHTGSWVEDVTMDGRRIKSLFSRTGQNRLVEFQVGESVNTTLVRDFYRDRLEVKMSVNNVTASSLFIRK